MARPLPATEPGRSTTPLPGSLLRWSSTHLAPLEQAQDVRDSIHANDPTAEQDMNHLIKRGSQPDLGVGSGPEELQELEQLRQQNNQLRSLCAELEQALQEAAQLSEQPVGEERLREYDALLEEKTDTIRQLHQELQHAHSMVAELESLLQEAVQQRPPDGPTPREEELLALSEELERERRQLQEDEQTLMEQMREMEVSMARERAEMARQRNDLTRLQAEIRHELERLEKSGTAVRKMEELKRQFLDATTRRGMASTGHTGQAAQPAAPQQQAAQPKKDSSLMSRLFGGK